MRGRSSPAPSRPPLLPPSLRRGPLTGLPTQQPEEEKKKARHGSAAAARPTERPARMKPANEGARLRKRKGAGGTRLRVAHARNRTGGSAGGGTKRAGGQRRTRSLKADPKRVCIYMCTYVYTCAYVCMYISSCCPHPSAQAIPPALTHALSPVAFARPSRPLPRGALGGFGGQHHLAAPRENPLPSQVGR